MTYVSAIVLAAGKGLRFSRIHSFTGRGGIPTRKGKMVESGNSGVPKPLVKINSQPIIIYCLKIISKYPSIKDIVLVVNAQIKDKIIKAIKRYRISKIIQVVAGGRRRQDSVYQGLGAIDERTDLVLIHDGVRPFITKGIITSVIKKAKDTGAAIVGVPVKATIKEIAYRKSHLACRQAGIANRIIVKKTLDRNSLWEIQTPQVFRKDLILKAYKRFGNKEVTDDAALVEKLGAKVKLVKGSYFNIKITTPEDLVIAEAILKTRKIAFS